MGRKQTRSKSVLETENEIFPSRLKSLMRWSTKHGKPITQSEVAEYIGGTRQAVSLYTTGQSAPDIDKLSKLADFFGVSADYLIGRTEVQSPDIQYQTICKMTGLSEDAIVTLTCYANLLNNSKKDIDILLKDSAVKTLWFINELLEDYNASDEIAERALSYAVMKGILITAEDKARRASDDLYKEKIDRDVKDVKGIINTNKLDYYLFSCQKVFTSFIERLRTDRLPSSRPRPQ